MRTMWYIGLDVHVDATAVCVRSAKGGVVRREVVATTRSALRHAMRGIRGKSRVICESGPLAPWVRDTLETRFREVVVCDRRRTRLNASGAKSDRIDADKLSEILRAGAIHSVHVPRGDQAVLRQFARHYVRMLRERSRVIQRLRSLFIESGVRVTSPRGRPDRVPLRLLTRRSARYLAEAYLRQLAISTELVEEARRILLEMASASPAFVLLQTIPYVGEMRAAELLAFVGDAGRFGSRRTFWAYVGLGVVQKVSAEHRVDGGRVVRNDRRRGIRLSRNGHPLLKKLFRDAALHASIGRGVFRKVYDAHVARGLEPAVARVALARKIASVVLAVWRSGVAFDASLLSIGNQSSG